MKLDRNLQRVVLQALAELYPEPMGLTAVESRYPESNLPGGKERLQANLQYLAEHQLITLMPPRYLEDRRGMAVITAHGLDFLADDGGLSAILGVVTIKLHDDQVRLMLASRIQESDAPEEEKRKWLDQLRGIPADATKHLVHKLIDAGLAQWPVVLAAMQTLAK